ncbi:uncharacterized protein BXIN_0660 [Babesia sp. Xinjiang]|uniref:uncharacterized protein n=1 Tax=Babesia sp. Xinjiang TaxID=462227 RepID=UPI000A257618|nr:uncharacterized protein BXIN_0660 [Babesia sp. Xinjiang]ORM41779.1 hypothetical protein BXIN_0660 [Babesia sp. Xinjiang]
MPLKLKESVTVFLSVRKGLEACLLNEIKRNPHLNHIERIHFKRQESLRDSHQKGGITNEGLINKGLDLGSTIIQSDGIDKWRYIPGSETTQTKGSVGCTNAERKTKLVEGCTIRLQSGGLEVKCNREWLIGCVISLRSIESVWLRVGTPFRCHSAEDLTQRVALLPWGKHLPHIPVEDIPLRVISRHSSVWSRAVIEECLKQGIRSYFNQNTEVVALSEPKADDFCISVTLNRNTCYVAVQCSSRLSPRRFNFNNNLSCVDNDRFAELNAPFWSIYRTKIQAHLDATKKSSIAVSKDTTPKFHLECETQAKSVQRGNFIEEQQLLGGDKYDTADALTAGLLHAGNIFKTFKNTPLRVSCYICLL